MPLKDTSIKNFTGFIAHYSGGKKVREKENYFSKKLNKKCATNWGEIDKEKLVALELLWKGQVKVRINKEPSSGEAHKKSLDPLDWFFSQKGYLDMGKKTIMVLSRNIGYVENGVIYITSVVENTGIIQMYSRAS